MQVTSFLSVFAVVVFVICHVAIQLLSIAYVDWKKAKEKGVAIGLAVWGGYRHEWAQEFVSGSKLNVMVKLDKVRLCAIWIFVGFFALSLLGTPFGHNQ